MRNDKRLHFPFMPKHNLIAGRFADQYVRRMNGSLLQDVPQRFSIAALFADRASYIGCFPAVYETFSRRRARENTGGQSGLHINGAASV
ncbi:hypothetical protein SDC9_70972 [bioreactor metagenome]|uniref:Uncharacterized protein n=1 Tax=bioreactor metagenome TaxID=1076179 RepID=A0A644Y855_9ZZZZ